MEDPTPANGQHRADEPNTRAKPSKACVPCRARKVKCDAAVVGLPCSSCTSRQCPESCVLLARKRREKKARPVPTPNESGRVGGDDVLGVVGTLNNGHSARADKSNQAFRTSDSSQRQESPDSLDCQSPRQPQSDLLYLNILQDAVKEGAASQQHSTVNNTPSSSRPEDSLTPRNRHWNKLPQLDDVDNEYLAKKGVFDLPPQHHLDILLKTYFEYVYPFAPVIERVDFIRCYRSGNCSLFLLHAMLATATLYAPADVISGCGFENRSAAQSFFFSKANMLHDFHCENDPLAMLQGSMILGFIILDHPTDRDFQYWFHNSIRLAAKLDIRNTCTREDGPHTFLKLYRRIWWVLYGRDVFHSFVNTQNFRLLENVSRIEPITEDDWEAEDMSEARDLLSTISPTQKASLIANCELAQIFGQCLSTVMNEPQQDPRQLMRPLDAWRMSLIEKMRIGGDPFHEGDIYYLEVLTTSYRFESILCRLLGRRRRRHSRNVNWAEWADHRLRSAVFELDIISKRVLTNNTIQKFPVTFVTAMPALLALHIESALNPSETDLVRSMAQISINQTMLLLRQGQEIPALKRALPVFEAILSKKNLCLVPSNTEQVSLQSPLEQTTLNETYASTYPQSGMASPQLGQGEIPSFYGDFLGFDFLDGWQMEQLDFTGRY